MHNHHAKLQALDYEEAVDEARRAEISVLNLLVKLR